MADVGVGDDPNAGVAVVRGDVETFRVGLHELRVKRNIPAGMCPYTLLGLVPKMRKTAEDHEPIVVRWENEGWTVMDGRHRFIAALIAGRPDVLAVEEVPDGRPQRC